MPNNRCGVSTNIRRRTASSGVQSNSKSSKWPSTGMTTAQKQAMMAKNHVKMMCKSQAVKMGAKATPPM